MTTYAKCVHTEHCCNLHGCKYGDDDCPVVLGIKPQSFLCEECGEDDRSASDITHYRIHQPAPAAHVEPVAEVVWPDVGGRRGGFRQLGHYSSPRLPAGTKLYMHPQPAEQQPAPCQECGGNGAGGEHEEDCSMLQPTACVGCEGSPAPENSPCAVCGQKSTPDVVGLVKALESLLDMQDEDCRYDHHGYCQNHNLDHVEDGCRVARAKAVLAAHRKQQEIGHDNH